VAAKNIMALAEKIIDDDFHPDCQNTPSTWWNKGIFPQVYEHQREITGVGRSFMQPKDLRINQLIEITVDNDNPDYRNLASRIERSATIFCIYLFPCVKENYCR
jgi:hypothetical protein